MSGYPRITCSRKASTADLHLTPSSAPQWLPLKAPCRDVRLLSSPDPGQSPNCLLRSLEGRWETADQRLNFGFNHRVCFTPGTIWTFDLRTKRSGEVGATSHSLSHLQRVHFFLWSNCRILPEHLFKWTLYSCSVREVSAVDPLRPGLMPLLVNYSDHIIYCLLYGASCGSRKWTMKENSFLAWGDLLAALSIIQDIRNSTRVHIYPSDSDRLGRKLCPIWNEALVPEFLKTEKNPIWWKWAGTLGESGLEMNTLCSDKVTEWGVWLMFPCLACFLSIWQV